MYQRVIPRDLFNEAKLLKCLGQLSLIIEDMLDKARQAPPRGMKLVHNTFSDHGFTINQHDDSGDIYCDNLQLVVDGYEVALAAQLNSKDPYPLIFDPYGCAARVFTDDGVMTDEFMELIYSLAEKPCPQPK